MVANSTWREVELLHEGRDVLTGMRPDVEIKSLSNPVKITRGVQLRIHSQ